MIHQFIHGHHQTLRHKEKDTKHSNVKFRFSKNMDLYNDSNDDDWSQDQEIKSVASTLQEYIHT